MRHSNVLIDHADQKIEYTGEIVAIGPAQPYSYWFPANLWDNFPALPKTYRYSSDAAHGSAIPSCPSGYIGPTYSSATNLYTCLIHVVVVDQTQKPCDLCTGNSIFPGTGNKRQVDTDYVGSGTTPLTFTRTYNSGSQFGSGWRSNFHRSVTTYSVGGTMIATLNRSEGNYSF